MTFDHTDHEGRGKAGRNRWIGEAVRARHLHFEAGFGPGFSGRFTQHGFGPGPRGGRRPKGDIRAAILSLLAADETARLTG